MPLTLEDVIAPTTAAEIEAEVLTLCATKGLPTSSWQSGGVLRTFISVMSEVVAAKSLVEIEIARGGLGDLTSGEWAKLWAQQIFDVFFVESATATGYETLTNTSGTPHELQIGDLILAHRTTGKTYRNQELVNVPATGTTPPFAIAADEAGTASDAAPGDIDVIVAPGELTGVTATNAAAVLGADEETTIALVSRARAKFGSLSPNGPKDAYNYVARTPLDSFPAVDATGLLVPTSTPITRTRTTLEEVIGDVVVFLATAGGAPTSDDVDRVNAGIWRWAEPWGVTSRGEASEEVVIPVTYRVWIRSSLTEAQIAALIGAALAAYFKAVDIGGAVIPPDTGAIYAEALENVIHMAVPGIVRVLVTSPAVETTPVSQNQVPVLGALAPTITFLS